MFLILNALVKFLSVDERFSWSVAQEQAGGLFHPCVGVDHPTAGTIIIALIGDSFLSDNCVVV